MKRSERKVAAGAYAFIAKAVNSSTAFYGALINSLVVALVLGFAFRDIAARVQEALS